MIRTKPTQTFSTSLELTPLIDIIFIVVVFLLLTANTQLLSLPVEIPDNDSNAETATVSDQTTLITLQATHPLWGINEQQFDDWQAFETALLNKVSNDPANQHINIAAAHNANVEPLIKLLALLNEKQVANTQILMKDAHP